jgi:GntR family transcriptional repressor for pyruvate dehydrogenase complex
LNVGDKLPSERILAERFNVSRASIREAFTAMNVIGIIDIQHGKGSFVTDINIAPFINTIAPLFLVDESMENDLLDFRKLLEVEAVKLAAKNAKQEDLYLLEESLGLMKDALDKNDTKNGYLADVSFHKAIFTISDNYILMKAKEYIHFIFETTIRLSRDKLSVDIYNSEVLYEQHCNIYRYIKQNDINLAEKEMIRHFDYVKHMTEKADPVK